MALVGFFVDLTGAFLFVFSGQNQAKICPFFCPLLFDKLGQKPGKTGQRTKTDGFGLEFFVKISEIFDQKWPFAHFLPTFCPLLKVQKT